VVLQTTKGNIELAFYKDVAPVTSRHILELFRRGAYDTNHFFRVDKGFVAQVADVVGGRRAPLDAFQEEIARDTVPGEFQPTVVHRRGTLSMGRYDDPDSGTSSFSILLGNAPHLDNKYTVFGEMVAGDETLREMENAETRREGIFVMPRDRIEIISTYVKRAGAAKDADCVKALEDATHRADGLAMELAEIRQRRLPGR
jgi:cyclophilin family peptidyl-prolyl cis-trans isomerase